MYTPETELCEYHGVTDIKISAQSPAGFVRIRRRF